MNEQGSIEPPASMPTFASQACRKQEGSFQTHIRVQIYEKSLVLIEFIREYRSRHFLVNFS